MCQGTMLHNKYCSHQETLLSSIQEVQSASILRRRRDLQELE